MRKRISIILGILFIFWPITSLAQSDKKVLGVKIAYFGITGAIKGVRKEKSFKGFLKGFAIGAANGTCAWSGEKIATEDRKLFWIGREVHSACVSFQENYLRGKNPYEEYRTNLWLMQWGYNFKEKRFVRPQILLGRTVITLVRFNQGDRLMARETLAMGTMMFTPKNPHWRGRSGAISDAIGLATFGTVQVPSDLWLPRLSGVTRAKIARYTNASEIYQWYKQMNDNIFDHEGIHAIFQYREASLSKVFIEDKIFGRDDKGKLKADQFPILFGQDITRYTLSFTLNNTFSYRRNPLEIEARAMSRERYLPIFQILPFLSSDEWK